MRFRRRRPKTNGQPQVLATSVNPVLRGSDGDHNLCVRIEDLSHHYGSGELKKQVLFDNNLELARGEIVIMTGPSGSGKTTLLTLIGALRTVQEGSIQVLGTELCGLDDHALTEVRRGIGFIFQAHNLFESLTARQNVRMALELKSVPREQADDRAAELLQLLGLGKRLEYKPDSMSGGQRQRVAIARALANRPQLILAAEPTAALDKQSGRDVVDLLKKIAKEELATILIVTHDNRILDVADRIVNMVDGHVISDVVVNEAAVICEFLRKVPLFAALDPRTLTEVADKMGLETHPEGTVLVRQGDPGDKFYLIRSGSAVVTVSDGTHTRELAHIEEGDFFGEAALISGEPRNATVTATEEVALCTLDKEEFRAVLESSAPFKEQMLRILFSRQ